MRRTDYYSPAPDRQTLDRYQIRLRFNYLTKDMEVLSVLPCLHPDQNLAERARNVNEVVAIDGCGMNCARKLAEKAGVTVHQHLVVTDLGVEKKSGERSFSSDEVESIASAAWKGEGKIQESETEKKVSSGGCVCGKKCS